MPHSLRARLSGLRYKGIITDKDYQRLCDLLDVRKTGRWIYNQNGTFTCDNCGCKHSKSNFCPNCGVDMRWTE